MFQLIRMDDIKMIRLVKPYIDYYEVEEDFRKIFETKTFTRGPYVSKFSDNLRNYVGSKHAFLTTSATTALWTCMKLVNVVPGDEVAISDFSFPATANVVEDVGAIPIFVDVNPNTFNMCIDDLQKKITKRTKAVIFVDALGNPSGLSDISELCNKHKIPLIEDAACALGSSENGRMCGSIANLTCFSFHPRKLLCTGEGGAITTNDDEWAQKLAVKLMHGAVSDESVGMNFIDYGYNFRMTELQAVMGLKQLDKLDSIIADRNSIRNKYIAVLECLNFKPQRLAASVEFNVQSLVFKIPENQDRDSLIQFLKNKGIETTLGTYCQSGTTFYQTKYNNLQAASMKLQKSSITLPCYENVPVDYILDEIQNWQHISKTVSPLIKNIMR